MKVFTARQVEAMAGYVFKKSTLTFRLIGAAFSDPKSGTNPTVSPSKLSDWQSKYAGNVEVDSQAGLDHFFRG